MTNVKRSCRRGAMMACAVAALAVAGLHAPASAQEGASPDEGPLIGGADVGNAPYIMLNPDGSYEGFDVAMLAEIAERLGRPGYELVDQQWSGIFAGLNAQKFDMIMASTVMTEERAENVLFTEATHGNDYRFLTLADAPEVQSLDDLRGKVIAVNQGNVYDQWLADRQEEYGWQIERYAKNADAVQAVLTGRAFANLASNGATVWTASQNPRLNASLMVDSGRTKGLAFRKDDVELRNQVEEAIECMKLDGTIAKLHEQWLGGKPPEGSSSYEVRPGYGEPGLAGYDPTEHEPECE